MLDLCFRQSGYESKQNSVLYFGDNRQLLSSAFIGKKYVQGFSFWVAFTLSETGKI
jgi:hypothetical protein